MAWGWLSTGFVLESLQHAELWELNIQASAASLCAPGSRISTKSISQWLQSWQCMGNQRDVTFETRAAPRSLGTRGPDLDA